MYGYLLAILTGIFFGLQGTYGKVISAKYSARFATWATFTFSLPFVLVFLWYSGIPPIVWKDFLPATLVSFIINIFAWNLFYRALKVSPLSNTMPFTAFTPLFLIPVLLFSGWERYQTSKVSLAFFLLFSEHMGSTCKVAICWNPS